MEEERIFSRFVVAFGDAENSNFRVFAEIKFGGTGDVADVFDDEKIDSIEVEFAEAALDKRGFEMTCAAGEELNDRHAEFFDALGVACCRDIAFEHADFVARF